MTLESRLGAHLGLAGRLWIKDDTGNVAGSHKSRHLFGSLLDLAVKETGDDELVIASCGNAAVAAAVLAQAAERQLRVFIPEWAEPEVVEELERRNARVEVKERKKGEIGDPTVRAMEQALARGAIPFSVQGHLTTSALDGGRTIGWELAEQLARARVHGEVDLFVQVGGGALAASIWRGLCDAIQEQWLTITPRLHTVQTEAAAPLNRAWSKVQEQGIETARAHPAQFMWSWERVGTSKASGILDDLTYDWLPVMEAMIESGGVAHVVSEEMIERAHTLGTDLTTIRPSPTGTAGLAALLDPSTLADLDGDVVVFFTGRDR